MVIAWLLQDFFCVFLMVTGGYNSDRVVTVNYVFRLPMVTGDSTLVWSCVLILHIAHHICVAQILIVQRDSGRIGVEGQP